MSNFKLFYEATQDFVDKIKHAIPKVSERPFNELFGNKDRFLVKIPNPSFESMIKNVLNTDINVEHYTSSVKEKKRINTLFKNKYDKTEQLLLDTKQRYKAAAKKFLEANESTLKKYIKSIIDNKGEGDFETLEDDTYRLFRILYRTKDYSYDNPHQIIRFNSPPFSYEKLKMPKKGKIKPYDFFKFLKNLFLNKTMIQSMMTSSTTSASRILLDMVNTFKNNYWEEWNGNYYAEEDMKQLREIKKIINENNMYNYLLFTRHPVDVLRMSDHRGISSCHRLGGGKYSNDDGMYQNCALADAQNSGGLVYLVSAGQGAKIEKHLGDEEIFEDLDRGVHGIRPMGRIRLRRFIDLETGKDFAVPTIVKYGKFYDTTGELIMKIVREKQSIFNNPPTQEYAEDNIVMVGGHYSDEDIPNLLNKFFNKSSFYKNVSHEASSKATAKKKLKAFLSEIKSLNIDNLEVNGDVNFDDYGTVYRTLYFKYSLDLDETTDKKLFEKDKDRLNTILDQYNRTWNSQHEGLAKLLGDSFYESRPKADYGITFNEDTQTLISEVSLRFSNDNWYHTFIRNFKTEQASNFQQVKSTMNNNLYRAVKEYYDGIEKTKNAGKAEKAKIENWKQTFKVKALQGFSDFGVIQLTGDSNKKGVFIGRGDSRVPLRDRLEKITGQYLFENIAALEQSDETPKWNLRQSYYSGYEPSMYYAIEADSWIKIFGPLPDNMQRAYNQDTIQPTTNQPAPEQQPQQQNNGPKEFEDLDVGFGDFYARNNPNPHQ